MRTHPSKRILSAILTSVSLIGALAILLAAPRATAQFRRFPAAAPAANDPALFPKPPVVEMLLHLHGGAHPRGAQVCGEISADTVWTAATGVYTVTCDVHVSAGVTLTIEPGVTVQFEHTVDDLVVSGCCTPLALEAAPIIFQPTMGAERLSTERGSWGRVAFLTGSAGVLDHARLEYGGHEDGQLYLASEQVQVLNSVVQYSADTGIVIQMVLPEAGQISPTHRQSGLASLPNVSAVITRIFLPIVTADAGSVVQPVGPVISNTQVLSNTGFYGGGLYNDAGSPTIQGNTFAGNSVSDPPWDHPGLGGGLYNGSGNPIIQNNIFTRNSNGYVAHGGGLYNDSGSPTIEHNVFTDNCAGSYGNGGGMFNRSGNPTIDNNVFSGNGAEMWGAACITIPADRPSNRTPSVTTAPRVVAPWVTEAAFTMGEMGL